MNIKVFSLGLAILVFSALLWFYSSKFESEKGIMDQKEIKPITIGEPKVEMTNHTYLMKARILVKNNLNRTVKDLIYFTIPRNLTYQTTFLKGINPEPKEIRIDEDGNVFAVIEVEVKPNMTKWINMTVEIHMAEYDIDETSANSYWPDEKIVKELTIPTRIWNTENKTLIEIAEKYGKGDTPLDIAESLAKWVARNTLYEVTNVRKGSDRAIIKEGFNYKIHGDCVEVADTYVTLARIKGLPARTAFGFMLTNKNELMWLNYSIRDEGERVLTHWGGHMWSQVYVPPWGWVDVEVLEGYVPKMGEYSWRHIVLGVEETKYYGTTLSNFAISGYLEIQYAEYEFKYLGGG